MSQANQSPDRRHQLSAAKQTLLQKRLDQALHSPVPQPAIPRRADLNQAPLSVLQEGIWLMTQLQPDELAANRPVGWRLHGALDCLAMEWALARLLERHEALRAQFYLQDGRPQQRIAAMGVFQLPVEDLSALPLQERETQARRLTDQEARQAFDLECGPLMRARLLRLSEDDHILVLTFHHLVFDAWSEGVLLSDLAALYTAFVVGLSAQLPDLPIQYADFAAWQRQRLSSGALQADLNYWKARLAQAPAALQLPADSATSSALDREASSYISNLPADLINGLESLANDNHATLPMTLLAAFLTLLYRHSSQEDLLIGLLASGRVRTETEGLIGLFANILPLRCELKGRLTFLELLERARQAALEAYEHQELPFVELARAVNLHRDQNRSPLRILFNFENFPAHRPSFPGLDVQPYSVDTSASFYDLSLEILTSLDGLRCVWVYRYDAFHPLAIQRLAEQYLTLLQQVVRAPNTTLDRLSLLSPQERCRLIESYSVVKVQYPREKTVAELFGEAAERYREQAAVRYGERRLSYGELDERTNRLARWLRRQGVGRERLVGLGMERGIEMVIGMLGVIKAGGAYVPLDASYPAERLSYMIGDSGVELVLSSGGVLKGQAGVRVVQLEEVWGEVEKESGEGLEGVNEAGDLGYVMYTSGSTGKPKGVSVVQRGMVRLVKGADYLQVRAGERVGQASNMSFDAATFEIWGALLNGGELVGVEREAMLRPRGLGGVLRELGVEHLFVTTALFNQIAAVEGGAFRGLKTVLFGGEAATVGWVRAVVEAGGPERLLHVYGPTESTTFATWYEVKGVGERERTVAIGRAIANTSAYVLDEEMELTAEGVVGELYLGGDGLARGYWKQAGQTAEKFVPHPYGEGERLYRTGDMVRRRWDGEIEFVGRRDEQVKVRGYRIELGEIEAVLGEHEGVEQAAVVLVEEGGEKRLVGYVVKKEGEEVRGAELRQWLKVRLPEYMLPGQWVMLERMPLTPNGKVDRKALPPPSQQEVYEARLPRTALEKTLAHLWAEVLQVDRVSLDDNFFELGGHSLLAMRVAFRIQELLQVEAPVRLFYENHTLADFAAAITAYAGQEQALERVASLVLRVAELSDKQALSEEWHDDEQ
jgi:amino acid adenylation domain-containing protein